MMLSRDLLFIVAKEGMYLRETLNLALVYRNVLITKTHYNRSLSNRDATIIIFIG